jgi:hypothetical protein
MEEPDRLQMTMYLGACTLHAGDLRLQHSLSICITYCFSTATMVMRTRLSVTAIRSLPVLFSNSYDPYRRIDPGQIIICAYFKVIYA